MQIHDLRLSDHLLCLTLNVIVVSVCSSSTVGSLERHMYTFIVGTVHARGDDC